MVNSGEGHFGVAALRRTTRAVQVGDRDEGNPRTAGAKTLNRDRGRSRDPIMVVDLGGTKLCKTMPHSNIDAGDEAPIHVRTLAFSTTSHRERAW